MKINLNMNDGYWIVEQIIIITINARKCYHDCQVDAKLGSMV